MRHFKPSTPANFSRNVPYPSTGCKGGIRGFLDAILLTPQFQSFVTWESRARPLPWGSFLPWDFLEFLGLFSFPGPASLCLPEESGVVHMTELKKMYVKKQDVAILKQKVYK